MAHQKLFLILTLAVMSVSAIAIAHATTLSGDLTADNAFFAYISTNDAVLGTLVASGNSWPTTFTFSGAGLSAGVTNYLHVEVVNYGGPGGFIGDFSLSDSGFHFANGSQLLLTDTTDWSGIYNNSNSTVVAQPWVQPTAGVVSFGVNGVAPWGFSPGINPSSMWIWPNDPNSLPNGVACPNCTVDFSAMIIPGTTVPEPGSLLIFGTGVLGLAGVIRRKLMR